MSADELRKTCRYVLSSPKRAVGHHLSHAKVSSAVGVQAPESVEGHGGNRSPIVCEFCSAKKGNRCSPLQSHGGNLFAVSAHDYLIKDATLDRCSNGVRNDRFAHQIADVLGRNTL